MKITLIGMSNSGKSYWAKKLEESGFMRLCSDDYIEKKLGHELKKLGYSGIADVSKWLGQPYEGRHEPNSDVYLNFENESLKVFINKIKFEYKNKNVVTDTTGSVIYTETEVLNQLKKITTIIYLNTPASVQEQMYKSYIQNPKPVLWGDSYKKNMGESDMDTLKRCYPGFLAFRTKRYKEYADISINYQLTRSPDFSVENFMSMVSKKI